MVKKCANKLNEKVNRISLDNRGVDEKTAMMLCALDLEKEKVGLVENDVGEEKQELGNGITEDDIYDAVAESMENVSGYIAQLANKINDALTSI